MGVMGVLLCILLLTMSCHAQEGPVVDTIYGRISGLLDTTEAGNVYEKYLGVPFASPPLGELRFAKSIPPEPWEGTLDTVEFSKGCIEIDNSTETSEDCLYINVFVPGQNRSGDNLAVMLWVYGGAYTLGEASPYLGQDLAVHGDVIVVTFNYRIGVLGFLSTEDEASPGNYGLWDVKLALEWVRDNIAAFGGSPDRVTLFGRSAGGAITSHMMISPETQGLFERGICFSGTSTSYFGTALPGNAFSSAQKLGEAIGCPDVNNSAALVSCLQQQDAHDVNFYGYWSVVGSQMVNFMPVIDGEFIPQDPAITWNQSAPADLDMMTGAVIHDSAAAILMHSMSDPNTTFNLAETLERTEWYLKRIFYPYPGDEDNIAQALVNQYPGIADNDTVIRTKAVTELTTDLLFHNGPHYEASQHSLVAGATYMFEYAYPNSYLQNSRGGEHDWVIAEHGDDVVMVFGEIIAKDWIENILKSEFSEEDKEMNSYMMSYITNFAKTGNPNEGREVPAIWPQYSREGREFLQFSEDTQVQVETEEDLDNYRFWTEEFPKIAIPNQQMDLYLLYQQLQDGDFENEIYRDYEE